ncbi:conserved hypothetical protein [Roseibium sp. TrichSKD4]|uniref:hypothetical protein n=1 Tax=Roseibium sp. TrichSKD4 TaxID=744980 RepID=UPI0001E566BC|nr:hypothetical protein [Roseibium sp. TrichSKD4]EFO34311.1 conserved hypothetical protein [Roseibium sp. TrichSKD4]
MSLSNSTFLLFLFLVPGLLFRLALFQGEIVKRPFPSPSSLWSAISILIYSASMFMLFFLVTNALLYLVNLVHPYEVPVSFADFDGVFYLFYEGARLKPLNFLYLYPHIAVVLSVVMAGFVIAAAYTARYLARKIQALGRVMYGPLAPLLAMEKKGAGIFTCFVLTKIADGNKRLMYAGYPAEVSLKDASTIDHIVLADPIKFYLKLGRDLPISSLPIAREVSSSASISHLYIAGSDIENVHFEGFYIEQKDGWLEALKG